MADLTDAQWERISPFIPVPPRRADGKGRPRTANRPMLDGMLWVLCSGARWQALPERAIRLAENWITSREYQRQQALRAVAEEQEEYTVKE